MDAHILKLFLLCFIFYNPLFAEGSHDEKHADHAEGEKHDEHAADEKHEEHGADEGHNKGHKHDEEKEHSEEGHEHGKKDAHGHGESGHEEESSKFGPGKAILAVKDEGLKYKLSPESLSFLKIKFGGISPSSQPSGKKDSKLNEVLFVVPRSAVAYFQAETSVYRLSDAWIEEVPVEIVKKEKDQLIVRSKKLKEEDQIAISGVHFLRTAQLEASGQGGEGHAH